MICWNCESVNDILDEVIGTCRSCTGDLFIDPADVAAINKICGKE
jgi:hypothetical protein